MTFNRKKFELQRRKYLTSVGKSKKLKLYSQKFTLPAI